MPLKQNINEGDTLAEIIAWTTERAKHPVYLERGRPVVKELASVRRFSLDQKSFSHVEISQPIPTREILGGLNPGCFKTNKFWLEMRHGSIFPELEVVQIGALIEADDDGRGFSFKTIETTNDARRRYLYQSMRAPKVSYEEGQRLAPSRFGQHVNFDWYNITTKVDQNGIHISDEIFDMIEEGHKTIFKATGLRRDNLAKIDLLYQKANLIARALYVMGSPNIVNNISVLPSVDELALQKGNKNRVLLKRSPNLRPEVVICDLTAPRPDNILPRSTAEAKAYFGQLTVSKSRQVRRRDGSLWLRQKDGQPWTRKEHVRRTQDPSDRTGLPRIITSSRPAQLDLPRIDRRNLPGSENT
jgi:hypothetical protein